MIAVTRCYADPWLLDNALKVRWANMVAFRLGEQSWRLGDFCWYRPER